MGGGSVWNLGSARGPFTAKKRPLFDENAFLLGPLQESFLGLPLKHCEPLFPLQYSRTPSGDCFLRVPVRGTGICQKLSQNLSEIGLSNFDQFF